MEEDIKIFGSLPNLIEIPADVLLYWSLKSTDLKGIVTNLELQQYRRAICRAYYEFQTDIKEVLGFNFPYRNNYQHELFEEVILSDGKTGFRLRKAKNKKEQELLEYRLVKLEAFSRMQKPITQEMFLLADRYYRMEQPVTHTLKQGLTIKQKVLKLIETINKKHNQE